MIKKIWVFTLLFALLMPFALSESLMIDKVEKGNVVISEVNNPAVFEFTINNLNGVQQAEIYSYVGLIFSPRGSFDLPAGKSTIEVKAYPNSEIRSQKGLYNFEYEIKGSVSGITKDTLTIRIVGLKDAISLSAKDINIGDNNAIIVVENTQNTNLENLRLHFSSLFFDESKDISLEPFESKEVVVRINKDKLKGLAAGQYVFSAEVGLDNANVKVDGTLDYSPKEDISSSKDSEGFVIRKNTYTRTNVGNVPTDAKIETNRDILSRLFTINSAEPLQVKRNTLLVTYIWEKRLQPGESFSVTTTTNYTFPFILVLLIIIVALLVKMYTRTNLVIEKRVSYVKTKGGEFALKVRLHVKAKKYVENLQIIDRLPGMTQLYEKFGIMPNKIDPATRRLFWNIDKLNAGEERVFSYIVYSKMRVVGRFELPSATATYLRDGNTESVVSNRTFFVAENVRSDI